MSEIDVRKLRTPPAETEVAFNDKLIEPAAQDAFEGEITRDTKSSWLTERDQHLLEHIGDLLRYLDAVNKNTTRKPDELQDGSGLELSNVRRYYLGLAMYHVNTCAAMDGFTARLIKTFTYETRAGSHVDLSRRTDSKLKNPLDAIRGQGQPPSAV